jgi:hypothetical protein
MVRPLTALRTTSPASAEQASRLASRAPPPSAANAATPRAVDRFDGAAPAANRSRPVDMALDGVQLALDGAGFVPGWGEVADASNAAISLLRGDHVGALLSLVSCFPGAGDAVTKPIKLALKANAPLPVEPARRLLAELNKHGPGIANKLEEALHAVGAGKFAPSIAGALNSSIGALKTKLTTAVRAGSARGAAASTTASIERTLQRALPAGAPLGAAGTAARDAVARALKSKNPADARAALEELAQFAGAHGARNPELKSLRRQLEGLATPRVATRPARTAARANPVDVFADGARLDGKRLARLRLEDVDGARAFVTHGRLGDFAQKGAHVHARVGGVDVEVALAGRKAADGSLRLSTSMVQTESLKRLSAPQTAEAMALVRQRLATDPAYRKGLLDAVSDALAVAAREGSRSQILPGARLLEKALKSTL